MAAPQSSHAIHHLRVACVIVTLAVAGLVSASAQTPPQNQPLFPRAQLARGLPTPANPKLPALFLVGSFTAPPASGSSEGGAERWSERLAALFDTAKINVVDRAVRNRSIRSYISEGYWADTLALLKPGDVVLLEFGPDDPGSLGAPEQWARTLPGTGDDLREIANPALKQPEVIHSYGWYLREFVDEAIARGAAPVICSPISGTTGRTGTRTDRDYGDWARRIAVEQRVGFLDLEAIAAQQAGAGYEATGYRPPGRDSPKTEAPDGGPDRGAAAVIAGLKGLPHDPLAGYFSEAAASIAAYSAPPPATATTP